MTQKGYANNFGCAISVLFPLYQLTTWKKKLGEMLLLVGETAVLSSGGCEMTEALTLREAGIISIQYVTLCVAKLTIF